MLDSGAKCYYQQSWQQPDYQQGKSLFARFDTKGFGKKSLGAFFNEIQRGGNAAADTILISRPRLWEAQQRTDFFHL